MAMWMRGNWSETREISRDAPFSSPEPLVSLNRLGLVHEERVALGTLDLIG